jgi:hypothetical protein
LQSSFESATKTDRSGARRDAGDSCEEIQEGAFPLPEGTTEEEIPIDPQMLKREQNDAIFGPSIRVFWV